jgi:NAD(P)-dependent dehydrogenase (short-subunit alcohol dehydrogenase family)
MAEMTRKLGGKVAVVTGASQGLGEHLAFELAANGAAVAVAARNCERLEAIWGTIEARGGRAVAVPTDHIKRHPASSVAKESCEAIIGRRRELDLSPRIQKLATRARPFTPGLIDRVNYKRVSKLRSAFTSEVEEHQRASAA